MLWLLSVTLRSDWRERCKTVRGGHRTRGEMDDADYLTEGMG